jgi:hypothetical protein
MANWRSDRRQRIGAEMLVHRRALDRNVSRRLVRLERPVHWRSCIERGTGMAGSGEPIDLQVVDIGAPSAPRWMMSKRLELLPARLGEIS